MWILPVKLRSTLTGIIFTHINVQQELLKKYLSHPFPSPPRKSHIWTKHKRKNACIFYFHILCERRTEEEMLHLHFSRLSETEKITSTHQECV